MMKLKAPALALCVLLLSCSVTQPVAQDVRRVPHVVLSMVWSKDGVAAMMSRTLALQMALEKQGFVVVRSSPGAVYPYIFISAQHDTQGCLGGVASLWTDADTQQTSVAVTEWPNTNSHNCAQRFVEQLIDKMRL